MDDKSWQKMHIYTYNWNSVTEKKRWAALAIYSDQFGINFSGKLDRGPTLQTFRFFFFYEASSKQLATNDLFWKPQPTLTIITPNMNYTHKMHQTPSLVLIKPELGGQLPPHPQRKASSCYKRYVQLPVVGNQPCVTKTKFSVPSLRQRKLQN